MSQQVQPKGFESQELVPDVNDDYFDEEEDDSVGLTAKNDEL